MKLLTQKYLLLITTMMTLVFATNQSYAYDFPTKGKLSVGCNYWASHAGMFMWRNWDEAQVEKDFADLTKNGISVMRVFPLWPDFQPLTAAYGGGGYLTEWRQNDGPLQNPDCVDETMMEHFSKLCDIAEKYDVKLVVGLITGWMSGRLFVPTALQKCNVIKDHDARMWQIRFVRHFVREIKEKKAIAAWDLGNECNCMGECSPSEAWSWMYEISSAIRLEDNTRPVVSGMHPMQREWSLATQGELTDVLTTHPYPLFTADMNHEAFNTMRNGLHAAGQSLLFAGISGRPCFVEEAGDLGRSICTEERSAGNVRNALFSSWANGLGCYMWWCSFDFDHLDFPPYSWNTLERELGLMDHDRRVKPVLQEMKKFSDFMADFEFADLPNRQVDAVCLIRENGNYWSQAFGAYVLSRQAGFDIQFASADEPLPDANFYIMPAGDGQDPYSMKTWDNVLEKVGKGATLLMSRGGAMMVRHFEELTGNQLDYHIGNGRELSFELLSYPNKIINASCPTTDRIKSKNNTVIAKTADGEPVVTVSNYGKGKIMFVNFAMEKMATEGSGIFDGNRPLYLIYREAAKVAGVKRKVELPEECINIGITEHKLKDGKTLIVAINYNPEETRMAISVSPVKVLRGDYTNKHIQIPANDVAIFIVK